jgi:hypothetical protein
MLVLDKQIFCMFDWWQGCKFDPCLALPVFNSESSCTCHTCCDRHGISVYIIYSHTKDSYHVPQRDLNPLCKDCHLDAAALTAVPCGRLSHLLSWKVLFFTHFYLHVILNTACIHLPCLSENCIYFSDLYTKHCTGCGSLVVVFSLSIREVVSSSSARAGRVKNR